MTVVVTENPEETFALGFLLGEQLASGDFIALIGDLGAGKTQFVKGVASGLRVSSAEPVTSPTYTILNIYQGRIPLYHFDFYRLNGAEDFLGLGFEEYLYGDGASIAEWAGRLGSLLPPENLTISFSVEDDQRRTLTFLPAGSRAEELTRIILRNRVP